MLWRNFETLSTTTSLMTIQTIVRKAIGISGNQTVPIVNAERMAKFEFQSFVAPEVRSVKPEELRNWWITAQKATTERIRLKCPAFMKIFPTLITEKIPIKTNFPLETTLLNESASV